MDWSTEREKVETKDNQMIFGINIIISTRLYIEQN